MRVKLNVTQDDIDGGRTREGYYSPTARALKRQFPKHDVIVGTESVELLRRGDYRGGFLSKAAQVFEAAFDDDQPVEPATFTLVIN